MDLAAGLIVGYAMGITDLDPIPHGLIFERFLNPERISMPDVDVDERRGFEVIRYVTGRRQGHHGRGVLHHVLRHGVAVETGRGTLRRNDRANRREWPQIVFFLG